jgi:cyanobactin maturation PatA/PatG family protease
MSLFMEVPGLRDLHAEVGGGNPRIRIAVIDGPVDLSHPAFAGALITSSASAEGEVTSAHGTHVASILAGQGGGGVMGIAPRCSFSLHCIYQEGADGGLLPTSQTELAMAIREAVDQGADIVNVSSGEVSGSGNAQAILADAIRYCAEKGVLLVAAAGNDGCACLHVPAALDNVLAVGAADASGNPRWDSNFGARYAQNGLLAIGDDVLGAIPGSGTAARSGTSIATPVVSGVAALLLSLANAKGVALSPVLIGQILLDATQACPATDQQKCLRGLIDIPEAVLRVRREIAARADNPTPPSQAQEQKMSDLSADASMMIPQEARADAVVPAAASQPSGASLPAGGAMQPSGSCGCGPQEAVYPSSSPTGNLVFSIGRLYYDFGTEARLDYFVQAIAGWRDNLRSGDPKWGPERDRAGDTSAPYNPEIMVRYLLDWPEGGEHSQHNANFPDSDALLWTLNIDTVPVYAFSPDPTFGFPFYAALLEALWLQEVGEFPKAKEHQKEYRNPRKTAPEDPSETEGVVARVSQAGQIIGTTRLLNGTMVPTLRTIWRGFYQWRLSDLLHGETEASRAVIKGYLERIYNEFRNVGISPQDRALNYSAVNIFNTKKMFKEMLPDRRLDTIHVDRSTICRPDADCWDVTYRFFNPTQTLTSARDVYQYTIDVSDAVPVPVGKLRHWQIF